MLNIELAVCATLHYLDCSIEQCMSSCYTVMMSVLAHKISVIEP